MNSKITICNLALAYLGQPPIASLQQNNQQARWLNLFYNPVLEDVLRRHEWAFATVEAPLVALADAAPAPGEWVYKYPADALFIRRIYVPQDPSKTPHPFEARFDTSASARVLVTRLPQARVCYTRRMPDETQYDPAFAKCLALALASDAALALTGDVELAARLQQQYALQAEEARQSNMAERFVKAPQADAFSEVR